MSDFEDWVGLACGAFQTQNEVCYKLKCLKYGGALAVCRHWNKDTKHPSCQIASHRECLGVSEATFQHIMQAVTRNEWECMECTACMECKSREIQDSTGDLLLCERCDKGCHIKCAGLKSAPGPDQDWLCQGCSSTNNSFTT